MNNVYVPPLNAPNRYRGMYYVLVHCCIPLCTEMRETFYMKISAKMVLILPDRVLANADRSEQAVGHFIEGVSFRESDLSDL